MAQFIKQGGKKLNKYLGAIKHLTGLYLDQCNVFSSVDFIRVGFIKVDLTAVDFMKS